MTEYVRERVTYTLSPEAIELLEETAKALGLSKSAAVDLAIRRLWSAEAAPLAAQLKHRRKGRAKGRRS